MLRSLDRCGQDRRARRATGRRRGALHGIGPDSLAVATRCHLEDLGAQQALGLDRGLGAVTEPDMLVDLERDQDPRPVELDARTPLRPGSPRPERLRPDVSPPASAKYARVVLAAVRRTAACRTAARPAPTAAVTPMPTRRRPARLRSAKDFISARTARWPGRRP